MAMQPYPLWCHEPGCGQPAAFKIASHWSDGVTQELKTYALSCPGCMAGHLRQGQQKQSACRLAPGETLEAPGIFELARGSRDVRLCRRTDLEG